MSVTFRVKGTRKGERANFSYFGLHRFRASLAEAVGWNEWLDYQTEAMKAALFDKIMPEPPPPYSGSWLVLAIADFINRPDTEGEIEHEKLEHLAWALEAVTHLKPFDPASKAPMDQWRWELSNVVKEAIKARRSVVYD